MGLTPNSKIEQVRLLAMRANSITLTCRRAWWVGFGFVGLLVLGTLASAQPSKDNDRRDPVLLFMHSSDLREGRGKIRLVANSVLRDETLKAPCVSPFTFVFEENDRFVLFTYKHQAEDGRWEIDRYTTQNFLEYSERKVVLRQPADQRRWMGMSSLARRLDTGEYL
jgi:hypothetical protein